MPNFLFPVWSDGKKSKVDRPFKTRTNRSGDVVNAKQKKNAIAPRKKRGVPTKLK